MADREIRVAIVGDSVSLERAFARSASAGKSFTRTVQLEGDQLQASAAQNVKALAVQREELVALAAEYGVMGKAAAAGSSEAIAAAKLQRDALARLEVQTAGASGGFLAGESGSLLKGLAGGIGFIGAAEGAQLLGQALHSGLKDAAQLQKSGEAIDAEFGSAAKSVERFADKASRIGISADESEKVSAQVGLLAANLGIATDKAARMTIGLQEVVGSIAEIRGVDPGPFLDKLPLVLAGNTRALKQLGFSISTVDIKNEALKEGLIRQKEALTGAAKAQAVTALLTKDLARLQGQAAANSGDLTNKTEQLRAKLTNLETDMGKLARGPLTALVSGLLIAATDALKLESALGRLASIKIPDIHFHLIGDLHIPGSRSPVGKDVGKAAGFVGDQIKSQLEHAVPLINNARDVKAIFDAIRGHDKKVATAAQQQAAADLFKQIGGLPAIPDETGQPFSLAKLQAAGFNASNQPAVKSRLTAKQRHQFFDAAIGRAEDRVQDVTNVKGQIAALESISDALTVRLSKTKDVTRKLTLEDDLLSVARQIKADRASLVQDFSDSLQLKLSQAEATPGLKDDIQRLTEIEANLTARIRAEKDISTKLSLENDLLNTQQQLRSTQQQQRDRRQFQQLGLGPTGDSLVPQVKKLKTELGSVTDAVSGTFLDTNKTRSVLTNIRKLLAGGLGALSSDVRAKIQALLTGIDNDLKNHVGNQTRFSKIGEDQLLQGLGLDPATLKRLQARISQLGPGGTVPGKGIGAFGFVQPITAAPAQGDFLLQSTIQLDSVKVGAALTRVFQKDKRRNPPQKRGPFSGIGHL